METMWYFADGDTRRGPVSTADLLAALKAMPDPRMTYVWRQGLADWQRAGAQPELSDQLSPRAVPPTIAAVQPIPLTTPAPRVEPVAATGVQAGAASAGASQARAVAMLYRRLVLLVAAQLLVGFGSNIVAQTLRFFSGMISLLSAVGAIVILVLLIITTYRLMKEMGSRLPVLWALPMMVPFLNILVLLIISARAQAWCRERGIQVGFLGPTKESLDRLS